MYYVIIQTQGIENYARHNASEGHYWKFKGGTTIIDEIDSEQVYSLRGRDLLGLASEIIERSDAVSQSAGHWAEWLLSVAVVRKEHLYIDSIMSLPQDDEYISSNWQDLTPDCDFPQPDLLSDRVLASQGELSKTAVKFIYLDIKGDNI